jgi:spermidine/putrescine transport system permease protein
MIGRRQRKIDEWLLSIPSLLWLVLFFLIPTIIVFIIAFKPADPYGGFGAGWTLNNFQAFKNTNFPLLLWRTIWLSMVTTVICILLSVPTAYQLARLAPRWRRLLLMMVVIPFWTSFLVRIFAWKTILHPEGLIKKILMLAHLAEPETSLLYTSGSVLLVLVYTSLPFSILPIYAAAEKFDFRLLEAARDLGARSLQAFMRIFLPNIQRGVLTAVLMVFIPALGSYVIPDIIGGPGTEMLGNKIAQRTFVDRNLPQASWLSAVLIMALLIPMIASLYMQTRRRDKRLLLKEGN